MVDSLAPYLSPDDRDASFRRFIDNVGGEVVQYGASAHGRPLLVGRLPQIGLDNVDSHHAPASVLLTANIHGPEFISAATALSLVQRADTDPLVRGLRERTEVWVAPCLNPDGYARTWAAEGKGSVASMRTNDRGVDLNRNFPIPPGQSRSSLPGQGSRRHGDATFIGESELSEPEAACLATFLDGHKFVASANLHSFMGTTIPPRVQSRAHFNAYKQLCRAFSAGQLRDRYWRLQSSVVDGYTGELEDHQHHVHHTWAMTVECFPVGASYRQHLRAPSTFWRFNPRDHERWIENDIPGLVSFFLAALELGPVT